MNEYRMPILIGFMVVCSLAPAKATEHKVAVPVAEIESRKFDLGEIHKVDFISKTVRVFNRGTAPLIMKKIQPG